MTEAQADQAHAVYDKLWEEVQDYVDIAIRKAKLNHDQEEYVRTKLTEEVRFWKRMK